MTKKVDITKISADALVGSPELKDVEANLFDPNPQSDSDKDLHRELMDKLHISIANENINRNEAIEDKQFSVGNQWPVSIKTDRERDKRPCLTIDLTSSYVNKFMANYRENKIEIKTLPKDSDATDVKAKIIDNIIKQIWYQSNADYVMIKNLEHMAVCGFSDFRIITKYADWKSFDLDIFIEPIRNPFGVFWDPECIDDFKLDAKYVFLTTWISQDDFIAQYSGRPVTTGIANAIPGVIAGANITKSCLVGECFIKREETTVIYELSNGTDTVVLEKNPETKDQIESLTNPTDGSDPYYVVRKRETTYPVIKWYKFTGSEILEESEWPGSYLPVGHLPGHTSEVNGIRYEWGLIRKAKDAQRNFNYWRSEATEMVALAPKAPVVVTANMVAGHKATWERINEASTPILLYNPDPNQPDLKPFRLDPPQLPNNELSMALSAGDDVKQTMGLNTAQAQNPQGAQIAAQGEDLAQFSLLDNLQLCIRNVGEMLVDLIPKIYDSKRLIRVVSDEGNVQFQEINSMASGQNSDLTIGKYEVKVTTSPAFITRKEEAFKGQLEFINHAPQQAGLVMDLIAKNASWPEADKFAARLQKGLPPGMIDPKNEEEARMMAEQKAKQEEQSPQNIEYQKMLINKQLADAKDKEVELKRLQLILEGELQKIQVQADATQKISDADTGQKKMALDAIDTGLKHVQAMEQIKSDEKIVAAQMHTKLATNYKKKSD